MSPVLARKAPPAAVTTLAKAIELAPQFRGKAKSDSDYEPIRDDPASGKLACAE